MNLKQIRFFKYRGSKLHIIDLFNKLIEQTNKKVFVELFVGSGAIFLNTPDIFDLYIINDIDKNIISMWKAINNFNYSHYVETKNKIFEIFGDIKNNKNSYYNFRNFYNENYHFTDKEEKGIFLYFLANTCINSLLRFGASGMNQSFGNRFYFFNENTFNKIKQKMSKTQIFNVNYKDLKIENESLLYLDPPYYGTDVSYNKQFEINDLNLLIDYIKKNSNYEVLYSDLSNTISDQLLMHGFKKIETKNMRNISPNRNREFTKQQEVIYYNV
ncbi:MAG: site-specific DNA-methyltransferase (adenine-specific) [Ignavibacteriaceae bacterium]|nr:MAG: site-specific DNA-methyltransferase (adenine-specific) [Ignavibacteriaceae bacterium]